MTFQEWYQAADRACEGIAGVSLDDLPDGPSRDWYDAGADPNEYAEFLLANEGWEFTAI